jgi:hypothetical protein
MVTVPASPRTGADSARRRVSSSPKMVTASLTTIVLMVQAVGDHVAARRHYVDGPDEVGDHFAIDGARSPAHDPLAPPGRRRGHRAPDCPPAGSRCVSTHDAA